MYLIEMLGKLPKEETCSFSRECKQFFNFFVVLISEYINQLKVEFPCANKTY